MANWCDNKMVICHTDPEMVRKAVEAFNKYELLNFFYPMPCGVDFREWCEENWGTIKIDDYGFRVDVEEAVKNKSFEAFFGTASGLPIGAMEKAVQSGFDIKNYWQADWNGVTGIWENGRCESYDPSEYPTAEEAYEHLPLPEELKEANRIFLAFHRKRSREALRRSCKPEDFEEACAELNLN
jgi:hypothetical protein